MSLLSRILRRDDPEPEGGSWVDIGYGPDNPCPYPACHHNHPETSGRTP